MTICTLLKPAEQDGHEIGHIAPHGAGGIGQYITPALARLRHIARQFDLLDPRGLSDRSELRGRRPAGGQEDRAHQQ